MNIEKLLNEVIVFADGGCPTCCRNLITRLIEAFPDQKTDILDVIAEWKGQEYPREDVYEDFFT